MLVCDRRHEARKRIQGVKGSRIQGEGVEVKPRGSPRGTFSIARQIGSQEGASSEARRSRADRASEPLNPQILEPYFRTKSINDKQMWRECGRNEESLMASVYFLKLG
jgi:hypothetical protein